MRNHVLCVLFVCCFASAPIQNELLALDYNEFAAHSPSEQRALIAKSFSAWLDATKNIHYTCAETLTFHDRISDNVYIPNTTPPYRMVYHHWLLDDKYRMTTEILADTADRKVVQRYQSAFDNKKGVQRGTFDGTPSGMTGRLFARIDTVQEGTVVMKTSWFWLTDRFSTKETLRIRSVDDYLFPFLLKQQNRWEITLLPEEQRVKLVVPFEIEFPFGGDTRQVGKKTLILDPAKDLLPVFIDAHWEESPKQSTPFYQTQRYTVENSEKVGHFWIPTTLKYELLGSSSIPKLVNVHVLKISDIELGTVKQSDVEVTFPEGTEVVDAIQGIAYKTDARCEPIESSIEPLHGWKPPQGNPPKE